MPTATPVGFYSHNDAGFSFIYPSSWEVVEKSSDHLILSDSRSVLTMIAYSFPADEEMSITDFVEEFLNSIFEDNLPKLLEETQTELANNLLADTRDYLVSINGNEIMARFVYEDTGTRYYVFIVLGEQSTIQDRQQTLSRMFGSLQLFRPRPFGLDRNETITILGGDPIPEYIDPARTTGAASGYVGF